MLGLVGCVQVLLTAIATAWSSLTIILVLGLAWAGYLHWRQPSLWPVFFQRLRTLRWFLLALLVLHTVTVVSSAGSVRWELAQAGLRQVAVLLTLLLGVVAVLEPLALAQRIAALTALFRPLALLGLKPQRVGAMLALALEQAQDMRRQLLSRPRGGGWKGAIDALAGLCWELETQVGLPLADAQWQGPVEYHSSSIPWCLPSLTVVALAVGLMMLAAG